MNPNPRITVQVIPSSVIVWLSQLHIVQVQLHIVQGIATHSPGMATHSPGIATHSPGIATHSPGLDTHSPGYSYTWSRYSYFPTLPRGHCTVYEYSQSRGIVFSYSVHKDKVELQMYTQCKDKATPTLPATYTILYLYFYLQYIIHMLQAAGPLLQDRYTYLVTLKTLSSLRALRADRPNEPAR